MRLAQDYFNDENVNENYRLVIAIRLPKLKVI